MQERSISSFVSRYLPLAVWMVFISYASSDTFSAANTSRILGPLVLWLFPHASPHQLELTHFAVRKLAHLSEYALLGLLAARAFRTSPRSFLKRRWLLISFCLLAAYALADEFHQVFVPSRTPSFIDSLIDMTGGLTALLLVRWRVRSNNASNP